MTTQEALTRYAATVLLVGMVAASIAVVAQYLSPHLLSASTHDMSRAAEAA